MKKNVLLLLLMFMTLTGSAQYWEKHHEDADELKGTPATNLYYANISNVGVVIIMEDTDLLTFSVKKGVFDYKHYKTYYTVVDGIVGLYDENGDLVEKVVVRINVSEDSPNFAQAYINTDFEYEGSGAIKKVLSWIRNGKGSVRFIIPKYGGTDFDVKLPTLLSQKQAGKRTIPQKTTQRRGTKTTVRKK